MHNISAEDDKILELSNNEYDFDNDPDISFDSERDRSGNVHRISMNKSSDLSNATQNEAPMKYSEISSIDSASTMSEIKTSDEQMIIVETFDAEPSAEVRRTTPSNAGQGVNRLFFDPSGRAYGSFKTKQFLMKAKRMKRHVFLQKLIQTDTKDASKLNYMDIAMKVVFTQMPAKKGTKKFGERAIAAMIKEYKQLNEQEHEKLIDSAVTFGKDDNVRQGLKELCKIPSDSQSFGDAKWWIKRWLKDDYWGKQVPSILEDIKKEGSSCPAAEEVYPESINLIKE